MIQSKTMSRLRKLLNNFRGLLVSEIIGDKESWTINFTCSCHESLLRVISTINSSPIFFSIGCYDHKTFDYTMHIEDVEETAINVINSLIFIFKRYPECKEMLKTTDYFILDRFYKIRYLELIKYIRKQAHDGLFKYDANGVIDSMRICSRCKEEILKNEDILRILIESEKVEQVYNKLTEVECQCN